MKLRMKAIIWVLLFTVLDAVALNLVRLMGDGVHSLQVVFLGNFIACVCLFFVLRARGVSMHSNGLKWHAYRGVIEVFGAALMFNSLITLPAAEVKAILFLIPVFASIFAIYFLKEHSSPSKWAALVLGFTGAMVIVQPGQEIIDPAAMKALGAAVLLAGGLTLLKRVASIDKPLVVGMYFTATQWIFSLPFALYYWKPLSTELWLIMISFGLIVAMIHYVLTSAFSEAPLVLVVPFMFIGLIFAAVIGYAMFGDVPKSTIYIGGLIIVSATGFSAYREARKKT